MPKHKDRVEQEEKPVFPMIRAIEREGGDFRIVTVHDGMTFREAAATLFMAGLLMGVRCPEDYLSVAKRAVCAAEALAEALTSEE